MSKLFPTMGEKLSEKWQLEWRSDVTSEWFPCTPVTGLDYVLEHYTRRFRGESLNLVSSQYRIINVDTKEVIPCEIIQ